MPEPPSRRLSSIHIPELAEILPEHHKHPDHESVIITPNPYRQVPLRYLGYANELGESAKPLLPPSLKYLYHFSYAVAGTYVFADSAKCVELEPPTSKKDPKVVFCDALLWQTAASVVIPGLVINRIVAGVNVAAKSAGLRGKFFGTMAGLASIPLIIHPIDHGVEVVMDNTFRKWF
jgi:fission process protein 1